MIYEKCFFQSNWLSVLDFAFFLCNCFFALGCIYLIPLHHQSVPQVLPGMLQFQQLQFFVYVVYVASGPQNMAIFLSVDLFLGCAWCSVGSGIAAVGSPSLKCLEQILDLAVGCQFAPVVVFMLTFKLGPSFTSLWVFSLSWKGKSVKGGLHTQLPNFNPWTSHNWAYHFSNRYTY